MSNQWLAQLERAWLGTLQGTRGRASGVSGLRAQTSWPGGGEGGGCRRGDARMRVAEPALREMPPPQTCAQGGLGRHKPPRTGAWAAHVTQRQGAHVSQQHVTQP
jgi:hypothetical protein